jgi:hypothetical protein
MPRQLPLQRSPAPGRKAPGRSSRGRPASPHCRGSGPAASPRSAPGSGPLRGAPRPPDKARGRARALSPAAAASAARPRALRRGRGSAAARATVDLTRDRGMGAAQRPGDRAGRMPAGDRARDLLALFEAQTSLGAPAGPRPDAARSRQVVAHAPPGKAEPPPDLAIAQPPRSQLPDRVLRHLGQAEALWHLRISRVGQRVADSLGWCGGGLRPPRHAALEATRQSVSGCAHERRWSNRDTTTLATTRAPSGSTEPNTSGIIIRVSGVRVPPPASRFPSPEQTRCRAI